MNLWSHPNHPNRPRWQSIHSVNRNGTITPASEPKPVSSSWFPNKDLSLFLQAVFYPCGIFGKTRQRLDNLDQGGTGLEDSVNNVCSTGCWSCFGMSMFLGWGYYIGRERGRVRHKLGIEGDMLDDFVSSCLCPLPVLVQHEKTTVEFCRFTQTIVHHQPQPQPPMQTCEPRPMSAPPNLDAPATLKVCVPRRLKKHRRHRNRNRHSLIIPPDPVPGSSIAPVAPLFQSPHTTTCNSPMTSDDATLASPCATVPHNSRLHSARTSETAEMVTPPESCHSGPDKMTALPLASSSHSMRDVRLYPMPPYTNAPWLPQSFRTRTRSDHSDRDPAPSIISDTLQPQLLSQASHDGFVSIPPTVRLSNDWGNLLQDRLERAMESPRLSTSDENTARHGRGRRTFPLLIDDRRSTGSVQERISQYEGKTG